MVKRLCSEINNKRDGQHTFSRRRYGINNVFWPSHTLTTVVFDIDAAAKAHEKPYFTVSDVDEW